MLNQKQQPKVSRSNDKILTAPMIIAQRFKNICKEEILLYFKWKKKQSWNLQFSKTNLTQYDIWKIRTVIEHDVHEGTKIYSWPNLSRCYISNITLQEGISLDKIKQ